MSNEPKLQTYLKQITQKPDIDNIRGILADFAQYKWPKLHEAKMINSVAKALDVPASKVETELHDIRISLGLEPADWGQAIADRVLANEFNGGTHLIKLPSGGLYRFNGRYYQPFEQKALKSLIYSYAAKTKPNDTKKAITTLASAATNNIIDAASVYDVDPTQSTLRSVINCNNCELLLESNGSFAVAAHDSSQPLFSGIDVTYDAKAKCPLFEKTLLDIFAESIDPQAMSEHLLELMAYAIQPVRHTQLVLFFIGNGSNGKSTLVDIFSQMFGASSVAKIDIRKMIKDGFGTSVLPGKMLLVDEDMKTDAELDTGTLKKISQGGLMTTRGIRQNYRNFINTALTLLVSNHYPRVDDTTHGWMRRVMVIPFNRTFKPEDIDKERVKKIVATELSGILNLLLEAHERLCKRNLNFSEPTDCIAAKMRFLHESNAVAEFCKAAFTPAPDGRVALSEILVTIRRWFKEQDMKVPVSKNKLKKHLENMGYTTGLIDGYRYLKGYELNLDLDWEEDEEAPPPVGNGEPPPSL